jgi:serine/threonine-protein kinase
MIRVISVAGVAWIAWSSAAFAQSAGAQAEVLFRQGRELLVAGKIAEACDAFEESQKLEAAVTTLLNLAGCRETLGQLATAWSLFLDAERQTRAASDAAMQTLHEVAQSRAEKLEPRVSRLTINVPIQNQLDGLEITRASERVSPGLWNRSLPIDGGTYTISARAPGANQWSTQVTVAAEHDTKTVDIPDLRNLPKDLDSPPPPPKPAPAVLPPPAAPEIDRRAPLPYPSGHATPLVVAAGALALLGGGLGCELWAESKYSAAKSEMMSQERRDALYSSANTRRYTAELLATGGLAAGGAAVWLYLRDRNQERSATSRVGAQLIPTAGGFALAGWF